MIHNLFLILNRCADISKTVIVILITSCHVFPQASYQVLINTQENLLNDIVVNNRDEILAVVSEGGIDPAVFFVPIDGLAASATGWKIISNNFSTIYPIKKVVYHDNFLCFTHALNNTGAVSCIDLVTNEFWSKEIANAFLQDAVIDINDQLDVVVANTVVGTESDSEIYKVDREGTLVWKQGLSRVNASPDLDIYLSPTAIKFDKNGNIFIIGGIRGDNSAGESFIIKMDAEGNVLQARSIAFHAMGRMVLTEDAIYILNKGYLEHFWGVDFFEPDYAILLKLDFDLNMMWAKRYFADRFIYSSASIRKNESGRLFMSHTTLGAFPAIFCEIDNGGNILSQQGYPNYRPDMELLNDGSLVLGSQFNFDELGTTIVQPLISKTDTNGNIEGCITYPTCLEAEDLDVQFGEIELNVSPIEDLEELELILETVSFTFTEGCNFPPVPIPDFHFPDTLCLGDSARTTETYNRLANAREWHLTGPGVDSVQSDSLDFAFRFLEAGGYRLRHTVWVLGCSYAYEENVTVLPELEIDITPEYLCPDGPFEIGVISGREIKNYLWENGQTTELLNVAATGIYAVQADDGFCVATDTAEIVFVSELIGNVPLFNLPADTTVCERHLPFPLAITSGFTDTFFVNNSFVANNEYTVNGSGEYLIGANIYGCGFSETFTLHTSDCRASVYLPNVFSPNGDGINDAFFPQGKDFETLSLRVFDRWGGLRYEGKGRGAKWSPGRSVGQGNYLYLLAYENLLTGEEETMAGGVVLVR
ncbi:MAG: gliding motility-associated C-terminal domain-containing protein [Bacteroidota bacterium]